VVVAVQDAEARPVEEGEPELAGEGGPHEARRLVRREAEEDLLQDFFQERRCLLDVFFRQRHGAAGGGEGLAVGRS
jgi:hypothetical protein